MWPFVHWVTHRWGPDFGASAAPPLALGLVRLCLTRGRRFCCRAAAPSAIVLVQECLQHVRRRGRIVIAGACMAADTVLPAMEVEVRFVVAYSRQDFALALHLLAAGRVAGPAMITDRVGMDST